MTYIFLAAGKGSRLHPLTLKYPKSLYKLDKDTTILKRMVDLIKKNDKTARVVVVTGFMSSRIRLEIEGAIFVENPFYEVTNSIASLWFAKDYLEDDNITVINGDIVMEEAAIENIICKRTDRPLVCIDSSIKNSGDYNVQVSEDKILVMSKELEEYYGEYAGVTKMDRGSSLLLRESIIAMVESGMYDQWYENAIVQMIFNEGFQLYYQDIRDYKWTEVDCVGDMLLAKQIHNGSWRQT